MKIVATRDYTDCDICEGADELGLLIIGDTYVCENCVQGALEELHGRDIEESREALDDVGEK